MNILDYAISIYMRYVPDYSMLSIDKIIVIILIGILIVFVIRMFKFSLSK
jgi:hypothetical protein